MAQIRRLLACFHRYVTPPMSIFVYGASKTSMQRIRPGRLSSGIGNAAFPGGSVLGGESIPRCGLQAGSSPRNSSQGQRFGVPEPESSCLAVPDRAKARLEEKSRAVIYITDKILIICHIHRRQMKPRTFQRIRQMRRQLPAPTDWGTFR